MKHLFSLFTLFVMSLSAIAGDKVTLNDVMYGGYWPQTYAAIKPMADGEHFARMSDDRTLILKGSFKNGAIVDTLFNAATARGFEQKYIDGYQFSPDEQLILLQTKTKGIYRNSFTAEHYIYSRNRFGAHSTTFHNLCHVECKTFVVAFVDARCRIDCGIARTTAENYIYLFVQKFKYGSYANLTYYSCGIFYCLTGYGHF